MHILLYHKPLSPHGVTILARKRHRSYFEYSSFCPAMIGAWSLLAASWMLAPVVHLPTHKWRWEVGDGSEIRLWTERRNDGSHIYSYDSYHRRRVVTWRHHSPLLVWHAPQWLQRVPRHIEGPCDVGPHQYRNQMVKIHKWGLDQNVPLTNTSHIH